jgi:hypothetical protein
VYITGLPLMPEIVEKQGQIMGVKKRLTRQVIFFSLTLKLILVVN